jgi:hypothetical protein
MTKLSDAKNKVARLDGQRADLETRLLAAKGEYDQLMAEREGLEVRAYADGDAAALKSLNDLEKRVNRNEAQQRGLTAKRLQVLEELAGAQDERRALQLDADTARARTLTVGIAELQAQINVLNAERALLLNERAEAPSREARERREEAAAVVSAGQAVEALASAGRSN